MAIFTQEKGHAALDCCRTKMQPETKKHLCDRLVKDVEQDLKHRRGYMEVWRQTSKDCRDNLRQFWRDTIEMAIEAVQLGAAIE